MTMHADKLRNVQCCLLQGTPSTTDKALFAETVWQYTSRLKIVWTHADKALGGNVRQTLVKSDSVSIAIRVAVQPSPCSHRSMRCVASCTSENG